MPAALPYRYELFGLRVASQISLPELPPISGDEEAQISIVQRPLTPPEGAETDRVCINDQRVLLNIPEAGRYLVKGGTTIIVDPVIGGSLRNLRLYLLGSAFGALLHQRGILPLHANAMEMNGRAVAFMGHSGAGKSTMAAWFSDRNFNVLSDDVCAVTMNGATALAMPGIPRLRLWRDALEATGRDATNYELSFDDMEKYTVQTSLSTERRPLEMGAVYLLENDRSDNRPGIEPLSGVDALEAVMANTYRGAYVRMMGRAKEHLQLSLALVQRVPVFRATRRWGREHFHTELERLEAHAQWVTAGRPSEVPLDAVSARGR